MDKPIDLDTINQVIINGKVYDRYRAGDEPEGKALLIGLPLSSKTDNYKDKVTKADKSFTYWAKIGNYNKGVPIASDLNLLVRANPPQATYNQSQNSDFAI